MQGYAWLYLIAYPIDYIIYAYNYIYGFSLFADGRHLMCRSLALAIGFDWTGFAYKALFYLIDSHM